MGVESVIAEIDIQIARLQQARQLLSDPVVRKGPGRPRGASEPAVRKPKRKMSAAGRARIAAAQRARWAKSRKAANKQTSTKVAVSR